jgi:potassium-transporting ATPase KdpC subunit
MKRNLSIAIKFLLVMIVVTGIIYPIILTGIVQVVFPHKANGSLYIINGKTVGSELIGQKFDSITYFWSRPSAIDYKPIPSGATNLGPTSKKLLQQVNERRNVFVEINNIQDTNLIPKEMLFASGSGLDPHTSPEAVLLQVKRIVKARNFNQLQVQKLYKLIDQNTEKRQYGLFGEQRINILRLNSELNEIN